MHGAHLSPVSGFDFSSRSINGSPQSPQRLTHTPAKNFNDYAYSQQIDQFVKDVRGGHQSPQKPIEIHQRDNQRVTNQLREQAVLLKFKDEQINELKRQLMTMTTQRDELVLQSQLIKVREDTLTLTLKHLQDDFIWVKDDHEILQARLIHEQDLNAQLMRQNKSLAARIKGIPDSKAF